LAEDAIVELLRDVVSALERAGVAYAVTGPVASGIHGKPITSLDVDLVVRMTPAQAKALAKDLPSRFYRDEEAMLEAVQEYGVANLIDMDTSLKVDLSVLGPGAYHDSLMSRAAACSWGTGEGSFHVVSAEDVILMKLDWRRQTRSQKQWLNALDVARVQGARMDWEYLHRWADELGLIRDLEALKYEAGI